MFNIGDKIVNKIPDELATGFIKEIYTPETFIELINQRNTSVAWEESYPDWMDKLVYGIELDDFIKKAGYEEYKEEFLSTEDNLTPIIQYTQKHNPKLIEQMLKKNFDEMVKIEGKYVFCPQDAIGLVFEADEPNKYKINSRIVSRKLGALAPATIIGINFTPTTNEVLNTFLKWEEYYDNWKNKPIYLCIYDEPIQEVSFKTFMDKFHSNQTDGEFINFVRRMEAIDKELFYDYMKFSYKFTVPRKRSICIPEDDVELISDINE